MKDREILDTILLSLRLYADSNTPMSPLSARENANFIEEMRAEEKEPSETRVTDGIHDVAPTPIEEQHKAYDEYARYSGRVRFKLADWPRVYYGCVKPVVPPGATGYDGERGHRHWCRCLSPSRKDAGSNASPSVSTHRSCDCGYVEPMVGEVRGQYVWTGFDWQKLDSNYEPVK